MPHRRPEALEAGRRVLGLAIETALAADDIAAPYPSIGTVAVRSETAPLTLRWSVLAPPDRRWLAAS